MRLFSTLVMPLSKEERVFCASWSIPKPRGPGNTASEIQRKLRDSVHVLRDRVFNKTWTQHFKQDFLNFISHQRNKHQLKIEWDCYSLILPFANFGVLKTWTLRFIDRFSVARSRNTTKTAPEVRGNLPRNPSKQHPQRTPELGEIVNLQL